MVTPQLPDIVVPWETLTEEADDMAQRARITADYLVDAATAWERFRSYYQDRDTQDQVHTALDDLKEPTENWQRSLQDAATAISGFAVAGRVLEQRLQELKRSILQLENSSEEGREDSEEQVLADEAAQLTRDWADLQETTAAALAGISYGDGAGLPMGAAPGGKVLPEAGWAGLTGGLDDTFGAVNPNMLLDSLVGLDEDELRAWAAANPEAAALLAERGLTGPYLAGSPEALMQKAMADDAHLTEDGIDGIRTSWLSLSPEDQERLMLLFPAVFGNLNGVPFAQRAKANIITVAGSQQTVREQKAALKEPKLDDYRLASGGFDEAGIAEWQEAQSKWQAENDRLDRVLQGLDYAAKENLQVVMVGIEGNGQIVTMVGTPSADTQIVSTLVPGTGAHLGGVEGYTDKLNAIDGDPSEQKVSFYWQGTDLPQELVKDNATPHFNEQGGPLLAAFDYAVDAEIPDNARTTYVGYSAGGSMLGTAEREGLDSTNIVYVAPAGPGHEVSSPGDTANPDANRYWVQTRDDPIHWAQTFGGGSHGGSFVEGGGLGGMDVTRLESGFIDPKDPDSIMGGHEEYFTPGSTAAQNIQGVIDGKKVVLHVNDEYFVTVGGVTFYSPVEMNPDDYHDGKFDTVTTKELEK